jgi:hypothetical protein
MNSVKNYLQTLVVLCILIPCINACSKKTNPENIPDIQESPSNYAPVSILNKKLILYTDPARITLEASNFISSGTCSVKLPQGFVLTTTPKYTYSRDEYNFAHFTINYSCKYVSVDNTNTKETITADLVFTSGSGGKYTGYEGSRSLSGTFKLN